MGAATSSHITNQATIPESAVHDITGFRLLDLPVEILSYVLNYLNTESITTVRLVCKALDAVTFDSFADEYFAQIYCFICTAKALEKLRDILLNAPRLRDRIQHVASTDNYAGNQPQSAMHIVQNKNENPE